MVRSTRFANFVRGAALALALAAGVAGAAVILEDDFTDPLASHLKWIKSPDTVDVTVGGGSCTISNPSLYSGEYSHAFSGAKPAVFTISFTLKSVDAGKHAGVMFCMNDGPTGYYLTINNNLLAVFKYVMTGNGITGNTIYYESSHDLKPSDNVFAVSKSGSEFHLFLNGFFQGKFADAQYPSGDVALFVPAGTSAVFGRFSMTDEFTPGGKRTSFSDDFSSGELKYWDTLSGGGTPGISVADGALRLKNGAGVSSWMYVDMDIPNFSASVEARYVAGSTTSSYGVVLVGENPGPNQNIPMVHFAIRGERKYAVWSSKDANYSVTASSAIKGAPPAGLDAILIDTLEVKKLPGTSAYQFLVNGQPLSTDYAVVDFNVIGIGVFCYESLEVAFDNFSARSEGPTSINRGAQISRRPAGAAAKGNSHVFYDLRGRKRYTVTATQAIEGRMPVRAAGVYVNGSGREVRVSKGGR